MLQIGDRLPSGKGTVVAVFQNQRYYLMTYGYTGHPWETVENFPVYLVKLDNPQKQLKRCEFNGTDDEYDLLPLYNILFIPDFPKDSIVQDASKVNDESDDTSL